MSSKSQELINTLLEAETKAEKIVAQARENRVKKLKEARAAAEKELEIFRQKEEEKFAQESAALTGASNDSTELKRRTEQELRLVENDFSANSKKVVDYSLKTILDIDLSLNPVIAEMMKAGRAA